MRIARPHYYFLWVRFGAMDRNSSLAFGSPLLHSSCSLYTTTENEKKKGIFGFMPLQFPIFGETPLQFIY
jgi:hypothetical protein